MIDLYIGYGLLILFTFFVVVMSAAIFLVIGLGFGLWIFEDHKVDADWRPIAAIIIVLGASTQWYLLSWADTMIRMMWQSLPPLHFFG